MKPQNSNNFLDTLIGSFLKDIPYEICESRAAILIPHLDQEELITMNTYYAHQQTSVAKEFVQYASIEQLKSQANFFQSKKDNPFYNQLLFTLDYQEGRFKTFDKLKLFLEWGYSPNLVLATPRPRYHTYDWRSTIKNATLLHILQVPKVCELLISYGASTTATCELYPEYQKLKSEGITTIRTYQDYHTLKTQLPNTQYFWHDLQPEESPNHVIPYDLLNAQNIRLRITGAGYTPYALAVALGQRPKFLALKKYEITENLEASQKKSFEALVEFRKKYPGRKQGAIKKLFQLLKEKNDYALEHLEEVKKCITPELVFKLIQDNYPEAVKKIVENGWVAKDAKHSMGQGLMAFALRHSKTQVFKVLDEAGYNDEIEGIFNRLNATLSQEEYKNLDKKSAKKKFTNMPNGIIYYLVEKKYSFHNQVLLKHVIDIEKAKIEKELLAQPINKTASTPRPKMKI